MEVASSIMRDFFGIAHGSVVFVIGFVSCGESRNSRPVLFSFSLTKTALKLGF